jgi:LDH2 family malate/lactate/ureidoglycolate dehydrogenase
VKIAFDEITQLSIKVLQKYGYTTNEAQEITNLLLWAEKRGSSQGFSKLFGWRIKKELEAKSPSIEKNTGNMTLINANQNSHIVACNLGVTELLKNMKSSYSCTIGVKNAVNSCGALGYYTEQIANAGYVGIMISAADPGVAPYGGTQAVFGTNPLSIAIPYKPHPILLDMSTANLTWGDLLKAEKEGIQLPKDSAYDIEGNFTTDPTKAMDGCVMSFDKSFKGSGLSLMIQILAGPLIGNKYSINHIDCQYGSLLMAINPAFFGTDNSLEVELKKMVSEIKNSRKDSKTSEILLPGELGYRNPDKLNNQEYLEINDALYEQIIDYLKD